MQLVVRGVRRPAPNRVLVFLDSTGPSEAKVFRAHAPPHGACENLVCGLRLLGDQQLGGGSPVQVLVEGVQEQGRSRMKGELRRFTTVDNHEAVTHGDLEWPLVPEAAVREGAEELTLRRGEEGGLRTFVDATNVGDSRCGPPLVDKDWHAICQDIFKGIGGEQWERMFSSGRTNRRVWVVTGKWARRSTGCIIVWRGEKSETRSQRTWGNGNQCIWRWPGELSNMHGFPSASNRRFFFFFVKPKMWLFLGKQTYTCLCLIFGVSVRK